MKLKIIFLVISAFLFSFIVSAQKPQQETSDANQETIRSTDAIIRISDDLSKIAKAVETLNNRLKTFSETFSSNQGLTLSLKQQKLLLAFEVLNRAEERLSTLQKLKLEIAQQQSTIRLQLSRVTVDSLPESIDRYVSARATTNAPDLRDTRRQALAKEKQELDKLLADTQYNIELINTEITQTELFLKNLRQRLFPEIDKELSDF